MLNSEDARGGAARAAYRLHCGLRALGVASTLIVHAKQGSDPSVGGRFGGRNPIRLLRPALDLLPTLMYPRRNRKAVFYPGWLPGSAAGRVRAAAADIVHLHWIAGGFVNVRTLPGFERPLVWTLHDMWPFTGGCHYDDGCGRFSAACGECPHLGSSLPSDLSSVGWRRRQAAYSALDLTVVTPSRWLAGLAGRSPLLGRFPLRIIPNGIDIGVFKPMDKAEARRKMRLPAEGKVVLFGAAGATSDPRKGYPELKEALSRLNASWSGAPLHAVVFGSDAQDDLLPLGMPTTFAGTIADDQLLRTLYSAADVYVAPSRQENLSNTVMEALACGTPCAAFDVGGMPDMIVHLASGYLARPFDVADLAEGIRWILTHPSHAELAERARSTVAENFSLPIVARKYLDLYREVTLDRETQ